MASRVFYGICNTARDESIKEVVLKNQNDISLIEGDILTVYFVAGNDSSAPSLKLYNNSINNQNTIGEDTGIEIKTRSNTFENSSIWQAGETVSFCYTRESSTSPSINNSYYWELIEGGAASTEEYGVTKLFSTEHFSEWLNDTSLEVNDDKALAPSMLKKLYQLLMGADTESSTGGLNWVPAVDEGELEELGQLSLAGASISITYPLSHFFNQTIGNIPTHTGELTNNGPGPNTGRGTVNDLDKFITSRLANGLYFTEGSNKTLYSMHEGGASVARIVLDNGSNTVIGGELSGNYQKGLILRGTTVTIQASSTSAAATTITSALTVKGNVKVDSGKQIDSPTILEGGTNIQSRYQKKLYIGNIDTGTITLKANSSINSNNSGGGQRTTAVPNITTSGVTYAPIGVVGWNLNEGDGTAPSGTEKTPSGCNIWEAYISGNTLHWAVRNFLSKPNKIKITFRILYQRTN